MGKAFTPEELCAMATRNPADALGWSDRIGQLRKDLHGDVLVTTDRGGDPYRNLIEAVEKDVQFVAINGLAVLRHQATDEPRRSTRRRADQGRLTGAPHQAGLPRPQGRLHGLGQVLTDLAEAIADPIARYLKIEQLHEVGKPPPWLRTDEPWDDPQVTGKPVLVTVKLPPLDAFAHDAAYFKALEGHATSQAARRPARLLPGGSARESTSELSTSGATGRDGCDRRRVIASVWPPEGRTTVTVVVVDE